MHAPAEHIPLDPLSMHSARFIDVARCHGLNRDDALNLYRGVYRQGILERAACALAPLTRQHVEGATIKFVQQLGDDAEIESVIIPGRGRSGRARTTLCVSSQIGCAMGCTFCQTAQMGLLGQLTTQQIIGQWFAARHVLGHTIDNIVFMGMGEPMENLDAVIDAIHILTDRNGPAIAPSRITVSTVGRTAGIHRLAALAQQDGFHRLRLAVSINAPNDAIRSSIMPINRAEPLNALLAALRSWPGRVLIEYVLIPTVNDALSCADELAERLADLDATINVIAYNPRHDSPWPAPSDADVAAFIERLAQHGLRVKRRQTHGRQVMAACGQLGSTRVRISRSARQSAGSTYDRADL